MNDILAHNALLYDIDTKFHYVITVIYFVWFRNVVIIQISVHN